MRRQPEFLYKSLFTRLLPFHVDHDVLETGRGDLTFKAHRQFPGDNQPFVPEGVLSAAMILPESAALSSCSAVPRSIR
jgi:hypothetical protein